ncbi:hypothetical protein [Bacillus xiapuensis]|uniref:Uncharacterized protein n=1 Tax=Bacillus xiapuensis TaxID=2014075 RepID=A0ABU6N898_9BACI|nr:hypothetical protein [Bacillus xiapuensis]
MKTLINDTADVVFKRKSDGHLIFTAEAQLASISQQIQEDKLKGGIGNKTISLLRSDKEISLKVKNALFDLDWLSMTQGVAVAEGTVNVYEREENLAVTDNAGTLQVTITGTPVGTTVSVINAKGESEQATVATKVVTVPTGHAAKGEKVAVVYQKSVTGNIVSLDSKKFSEQYAVEYHTIEYDPATNLVIADLYVQFDSVLPSGSFDLSFENGNALSPELDFTALTSTANSEIGRVIEVPRSQA